MPLAVPPGRMGLVWLHERLAVAERARDVLREKLHALAQRLTEVEHDALIAEEAWEAAFRTAERQLLTARMLGGSEQVATLAAALPHPATVTFGREHIVGLEYPIAPQIELAVAPRAAALGHTSALPYAAAAYRDAVGAAGLHAAAQRAKRAVADEMERTERRLRSIERRWIPEVERALSETARRLDESDRQDAIRIRWVVQQSE